MISLPLRGFASGDWDTPPESFKTHQQRDALRLQAIYQMMQYNNMRHFKDNIPLLEEAREITKILNQPELEIKLLINESEQRILQGNYKEALEALLPVFSLLEKHPSKEDQAHAAILLAEIDRENDNFLKAIDDLKKQIELLDSSNNLFLLGWLHLSISNVHLNLLQKDYEAFLKTPYHLDKAYDYFERIDSKTGMALVQAKYARYYKNSSFKKESSPFEKQEYHKKAITYANQSLQSFYELDQAQNIAYSLYQKATAFSIVGNHKASVPIYEEAIQYYAEDSNLIWLKRIHQHLFVAFSILGDQDNALTQNKQFILIKDSIFNIEKRSLLAEAETKFNTQKIKAEKEKAELKSSRNMYYAIGLGLILSLILIASIFYIGRIRATKKAELIAIELVETQKRLALEKQYRDSELKALKAQMNPHFIFNALNSIQEYIILNQKNLASDYLGKFADLMRTYLNHSDAGFISIHEEIESLNMYLELESLRFEDSLQYQVDMDENLTDDFIKIPAMLVQPYVENAIKHGLLHKKENRKVTVLFTKDHSSAVTCIIEDNGVGRKRVAEIQAQSKRTRKSFATQATKSRLELLNFNKVEKIGVSILDLYNENQEASGTRVTISIPIKKPT